MTDKEILIKAVTKAGDNGFNNYGSGDLIPLALSTYLYEKPKESKIIKGHYPDKNSLDISLDIRDEYREIALNYIIFSHEFAKAFWGEGYIKCSHCGNEYTEEILNDEKLWENIDENGDRYIDHIGCVFNRKTDYHIMNPNNFIEKYSWNYHLRQMVLEKEPLKYLEKFLDE